VRRGAHVENRISGGNDPRHDPERPPRAHFPGELRESRKRQGNGWFAAGLVRKECTEADVASRHKRDRFKMRVAEELREKTAVTVARISQRLHRGTRGHLMPLQS